MKRYYFFTILSILSSCLVSMAYESHDRLFENLKAMRDAKTEKVEFTGGFPKETEQDFGFVMMKGDGNGLTTGEKIGLPCIVSNYELSII